jgi:hypothetical protein
VCKAETVSTRVCKHLHCSGIRSIRTPGAVCYIFTFDSIGNLISCVKVLKKASKIFIFVKCWPSDCFSNFKLQSWGKYAWFEASTAVWMGSSPLWNMEQLWLIFIYRRFGIAYRSYFQGQAVQEEIVLGLLELRSETSVTTNKRCITSQKIDNLVGGILYPSLQLYIRQETYFLQYF